MAVEIAEQPTAMRATLEALGPLREDIRAVASGRRHVLLVARGTSDNAAVYARYLFEVQAGVPTALAAPSIATHYRAQVDLSDTLVVSVSQSGATEEIVATQDWAKAQGAATLAIANVPGSPLLERADVALPTRAGQELAVPATKSYLTQLLALAVVGSALAPTAAALDTDLQRVPDEVATLLDDERGRDEAVAALADASSVIVSGRGLMLGTALESALKLEETCRRPVRGYSYADLRHGPIAVVAPGTVAIVVAAADGPLAEPMAELAGDLARRGARTIGIGGDAAFIDAVDVAVPGPDLPETVAPLAAIVPVQLIVETLARRLDLDPDQPEGLAKVTSTEGKQQ